MLLSLNLLLIEGVGAEYIPRMREQCQSAGPMWGPALFG